MAEGIAGNWQGKLIQALYTLGLLGSAAVTMWATGPGRGTGLGVASGLITVIGVVLLMFAETFFSSDRGMVGAMGQHGNKGVETNKGPDSLGENDLKPWERTMKEEAVEEGVVDKVKDVVKKGIDALKGPDDDKLLSKLEKETGGKRPEKKDEKMQESLMKEFANFRI
jgi:hypothetical protein